jgi:hypothetical protein
MATAVIVPWRSGCPHRDAAWRWVRNQYAIHHPTWQIVSGTCPDGPWVKALAVADALERTDADTLLLADADVWSDGLQRAVDALDQFPWAIPHHTVYRLTEQATAHAFSTGELAGPYTQHPYKGWAGGGFLALDRVTYERIPLDPRFAGWGSEDAAWHLALARITGRGWRGRADLWHLWHPPQPRLNRVVGSQESADLLHRYQRARTPQAMTELLEEARRGEPSQAQPGRDARPSALT